MEQDYEIKNRNPAVDEHRGPYDTTRPVDKSGRYTANSNPNSNSNPPKLEDFNLLKVENITPKQKEKILSNKDLLKHFIDINFSEPRFEANFKEYARKCYGEDAEISLIKASAEEDVSGTDYTLIVKKPNGKNVVHKIDLKTLILYEGREYEDEHAITVFKLGKNGNYNKTPFFFTTSSTDMFSFNTYKVGFSKRTLAALLFRGYKASEIPVEKSGAFRVSRKALNNFFSTTNPKDIRRLQTKSSNQYATIQDIISNKPENMSTHKYFRVYGDEIASRFEKSGIKFSYEDDNIVSIKTPLSVKRGTYLLTTYSIRDASCKTSIVFNRKDLTKYLQEEKNSSIISSRQRQERTNQNE